MITTITSVLRKTLRQIYYKNLSPAVIFTRRRPPINYRRRINTHFSHGAASDEHNVPLFVSLSVSRSSVVMWGGRGCGWPTRHVSGLRTTRPTNFHEERYTRDRLCWLRPSSERRRFSARRWNDGTKAPVVMSPFRPFRAFARRKAERWRKRRLRSSFPLARARAPA
jgi:hypothetical protein